jgi:hypothetical protein
MRDLGLIASGLIIISVFFPWIETSSISPTVSNTSFNVVTLTGISTGFGFFGIVLGGISFFMFYKEMKWSLLPGYFVIFVGFVFFMEYSLIDGVTSYSGSSYYQSIKYTYTPQIGFFLFLFCGIVCSFSGYKFLKLDVKFWRS